MELLNEKNISQNKSNSEYMHALKSLFQNKPTDSSKDLATEPTEKKLTIIHTNDTHSNLIGDGDSICPSKVSTFLKEQRSNSNVILLDAGDTFHGQIFATHSKGESVVTLMNALKYDAMTTGNHDFNYGQERVLELSEKIKFPLIAANVRKLDNKRFLKPYTIKKINGLKVGIFGLASPETPEKTIPSSVKGLKFTDPIKEAEEMVQILKAKNVDLIIALTHLGLQGEYTSINLAKSVSGIDIIADGHSHDSLSEGLLVNDTLITQAGEKLKGLGVINVSVSKKKVTYKKAKVLSKKIFENIPEDPHMKKLVTELDIESKRDLLEIIGTSPIKLDGERNNVRCRETSLGNLIADVVRDANKSDVSFVNGGGIRASIKAGNIRKLDILNAIPFPNYVVTKKISGATMLSAFEQGLSAYPEEFGGFPQVSGITIKYDSSKTPGNRIIEAKIGEKLVQPDSLYTIATSNAVAEGIDGIILNDQHMLINELLIKYIKEKKVSFSKTLNRIINVNSK